LKGGGEEGRYLEGGAKDHYPKGQAVRGEEKGDQKKRGKVVPEAHGLD
jgi:hypothetical protein